MIHPLPIAMPLPVSHLSAITLASVFDDSVDCVKLIGRDGRIRYVNASGLSALDIDGIDTVEGQPWAALWPDEARDAILASYPAADAGRTVRFRAECPTAAGDARWWEVSVSAVHDSGGRRAGYLAVSRDVTEDQQAREALEVATAELKHRLGNTYAVVGGLMAAFARGDPACEVFAEDMRNRLTALGRAQTLFVGKDAPCDFATLIPALVLPFERPGCPIVLDALAAHCADRGQADAIALAIGELAVNSSKHGALANGGEIRITTAGEAGDGASGCTIRWDEQGRRPIAARVREGGQGLRLMERIVRARRGSIDLTWHPAGLTATLAFGAG